MKKFTNAWKWVVIVLLSSSVLLIQAQNENYNERAPMKKAISEEQLKIQEGAGISIKEFEKEIASGDYLQFEEKILTELKLADEPNSYNSSPTSYVEKMFNPDGSITVTLGSGTGTNTTSGAPTPYGTFYKNFRQQYLILASELIPLGIGPGDITDIGFNVAALNNCIDMPNYKISIKHTTASVLTTTFENNNFTEVFFASTFLPVVGWNTHTFSAPFTWDGTSNLLIDICTTLIPVAYTQNASVYYTPTTGTNTCLRYQSDTQPACFTTLTGTLSVNRANMQITGEEMLNPPPGMPYNENPINGSTDIAIDGDITWTFGNNTENFDLWFGPAGNMVKVIDNQPSGATGAYTYSGLSYATTYNWQVVAMNVNGNTNGPIWSFTTLCGAISVFPWSEDFNVTTFPPFCWEKYSGLLVDPIVLTPTTSGWILDDWRNINTGDKAARINIFSTSPKYWLMTPQIDLGSGGYQMEFDLTLNQYGTSNPPGQTGIDDKFAVLVSTDGGVSWSTSDIVRLWDNAGSQYVYNNIDPNGETIVIDITGYTGIIKIAFYGESTISNADNDLMINNLKVRVPPTCPDPTTLGVSNITGISALLSWVSNSGLSDIEFGPGGFTPTGVPTHAGVTSPYDMTGLSPSTAYSFYVRDDCGSGGYSEWIGPKNFSTACATFTAPFVEHFQNTTIPLCWTMSGPQAWLFTNTWPGYGAAGLQDHTGTGGSFAGVDGSGTASLTGITLLTPLIDVSSLTVPQLRFYLFNNNVDNADWLSLSVDLWDGAAWNNSIYYWGPTDNNADWVEVMVVLSAYNITGDIQIRFVVDKSPGSPFYDDLIIDDVWVEEAPTCPAPAALGVENVTQNSADLTWTSFSGLSDIEFGLAGFTPTGVPTYAGVISPYPVSGLTGVTSYSFYVRDDCGGGDYSLWTGPFTFLTMPATTGIPVYEDFENGFVYFDNAPGNTINWTINNTYYHNGSQCAHNAYGQTNANILHETSVLDLSTASIVFLEFWQIAKAEGNYDHCIIEISTNGGTTYTPLPLDTYTGSGNYHVPTANAPYDICFDEDSYAIWGTGSEIPDNATWWQLESFDLSNYLTTNVRIRFRLHTDGSVLRYGWLLDDILIYEPAYGTLAGTVTNAANSTPIQGATISVGSWSTTSLVDGTYNLPGILIGTWNANCTAVGYNPASAPVTIIEDQTTTQNFSLTAPGFVVNPLIIDVTLQPNELLDDYVNMSNPGLGTVDWSAGVVVVGDDGSDALFDLQFSWPVGIGGGEAGIECDGNYIYTTKWNGTDFYKYELNGTYIGPFTCGSAGAIRDLAYDGTYFYGAAAATTVFQMDFTNGTVVSTFTAPLAIRAIAYSEDEDVFYGNNWSDNITKFNITGANLGSFPCGPFGTNYYGLAYDNYSSGAPYLWGYAQVGATPTDQNWVVQIALPSGTETGVNYNVANVVTPVTGIAGGLCIDDNLVPGYWTIMGCMQNEFIWGLELCEAGPVWLTIEPNTGMLGPGANEDMTLHFNATDLLPGVYEAEIHFSTNPDVGSPIVDITMTVAGLIPAIDLQADYDCTDVLLEWDMPTGGTPDSWNVYRNDVLLGNSTVMTFTDPMVDPDVEYGYYVKAVYAGVESLPTATELITVPEPANLQPLGLVATANTPNQNFVTLDWDEPNACLEPDGYNIYRDGAMINTTLVTGLTYVDGPLFSGLYEYKITSVYYFGESGFSIPAYALIPVGIEDADAGQLRIFPNPVSNMVSIESITEITGISIFSNSGQVVMDEKVNVMSYQIDVSKFEKGVYYIKLETGDTKIIRKITVN